jgi:hypothetical protein
MKAKNESNIIAVRNKYTAQLKEQALEHADRDRIPNPDKPEPKRVNNPKVLFYCEGYGYVNTSN